MITEPETELNERDLEILRDVVLAYLSRGEPVSSRQISKGLSHGLSPASVRNVMADLDDLGYLRQPHTSAGRVPTARGYHLFIDSLMESQEPSDGDRRVIEEGLSEIGDGARIPSTASRLLSDLSHQVGIVLTPNLGSTVVRAVELVPLTGRRVLCVVVSSSGFLENKVIELDEEPSREELQEVSNYLNRNFGGLTLGQMRERVLSSMDDERAQVDKLMQRAIEFASKGLQLDFSPELVVEGAPSLLSLPELADLQRVRRLFETFSDKARVVDLLNRCLDGAGVRVLIGDESDLTSELDFSLIVRRYEVQGTVGGIGLFGPSRMEYPRLIPLVDYLGERLSAVLAASDH